MLFSLIQFFYFLIFHFFSLLFAPTREVFIKPIERSSGKSLAKKSSWAFVSGVGTGSVLFKKLWAASSPVLLEGWSSREAIKMGRKTNIFLRWLSQNSSEQALKWPPLPSSFFHTHYHLIYYRNYSLKTADGLWKEHTHVELLLEDWYKIRCHRFFGQLCAHECQDRSSLYLLQIVLLLSKVIYLLGEKNWANIWDHDNCSCLMTTQRAFPLWEFPPFFFNHIENKTKQNKSK